LRDHLDDPFFCLYNDTTGRRLTLEYLRWLSARGEVPDDLSELIKDEEARIKTGTFLFCFCVFLFAVFAGVCLPIL
jgi:hypothetical protein